MIKIIVIAALLMGSYQYGNTKSDEIPIKNIYRALCLKQCWPNKYKFSWNENDGTYTCKCIVDDGKKEK